MIVVKNIELFSRLVLPRYFKHANFQSFVRQLHIYDFHKTATVDPNHVGYANENFRQGRRDLIPLVIQLSILNYHSNYFQIKMKSKAKKMAKNNRSGVNNDSSTIENRTPSNASRSNSTPHASNLAGSPPKADYFNLFSNALSVQNLDPKTLAGTMSPRCHAEKHSLETPDFEPKKRSSSCLTDAEDSEDPFELPGVTIDEHIFDSDRLPEVDCDFSCDSRDRAISLSSNDSWDSLDFSTLLFDY